MIKNRGVLEACNTVVTRDNQLPSHGPWPTLNDISKTQN